MNLFLTRIRKLLHALKSGTGRRALKRGVAASIEHHAALGGIRYKTVIDIGGNVGQFALFAREQYPDAQIFSFEPLEECWGTFADIFSQDSGIHLMRYGIGPTDAETVMHVTSENDSSSILVPASTQIEVFGTSVHETKKVQLRRLSSLLCKDQVVPPALLKIDVQGFELNVLKGCEELIDQFETVYVEASYTELYQGQALAGEVIDFLNRRGFRIRGVFNQHVDHIQGALQADFLFRRSQQS